MNDYEILEDTLNDLLLLYRRSPSIFHKSYKSLPLDIYISIEKLSMSKSILYKDLCNKAKLVAEYFHKSI